MTALIRTTAIWEGILGLPGYSQFYSSISDTAPLSAQAAHFAVREFFSQLTGAIPGEVTVRVDPVYQVLEDTSGEITSEATVGTTAAAVTGTAGGGFAAQVGVLVEWLTSSYIAGRHLKGRTYLVPLAGQFDEDGTLSGGGLALVQAAAPYISDSGTDFRVWHRPVAGAGGISNSINGFAVRDHAAVLRSRMR